MLRKVDGHVAWLTLNRPDAMNAFHRALVESLEVEVAEVDADPSVRVVVITGRDGVFSAGGDLKELLGRGDKIDADRLLALVSRVGRVFDFVARMGKPVIAAVNGLALAGGLELALACDLIIATQSARLGDAHSNYGLVPAAVERHALRAWSGRTSPSICALRARRFRRLTCCPLNL